MYWQKRFERKNPNQKLEALIKKIFDENKGTVGYDEKNRLHRRFYTSVPHQKLTTDTSEFKYYERDQSRKIQIKKLYLDPFLDLFNGEILSYRISKQPNAKAILEAQKEAIDKTQDCPYRRTFHSDQGWGVPNEAVQKAINQSPDLSKHVSKRKLF